MSTLSPISAPSTTPPQPARGWQRLALVSCIGLIFLGVVWEIWGAPIRPGGSWLALKVLPLLFALPGLLKMRVYTFQWVSMLSLLYQCEAIVRSTSDRGASVYWACVELALSTLLFISALAFARPYKRYAKALQARSAKTRQT
ncbi:DUF2069 domain-containing protein [Parvibium lacunae]|uniref:DUF2069 domain-containing protein n=1 Tax=Parvibium lacunae TaxID=1888893 RepID=A0A368L6Z4_9BURK|nr:DUF2069 domain-containing protein [Parvibium lacunae]RCS59332.1 DUF2069 domain-containing protein [Parvibium lacunae]